MNNCTRNNYNNGIGNHYLLPIPHYLLPILLFFSTLTFGQVRRLSVAGNIAADTVKANSIKTNTGQAGELLLANGTIVPKSTMAGSVLTSNANAAPSWQTAPAGVNADLITQAATAGLNSATGEGIGSLTSLGIQTQKPNSLFTIDGTGYPAEKIFNISSNTGAAPILNSVNNSFLGFSFSNNNTNQWFMGLYPNAIGTAPNNLFLGGPDYTNDVTPGATNVGINRNDPNFTLDIEGSLEANGYRYNIRKFFPPSGVTTSINVNWFDDYIFVYPTGSDISNITINFTTLPGYDQYYYDSTIPGFNRRLFDYTSKRVVVKFIGSGTVTNNKFAKLNFDNSTLVSKSLYNDGYSGQQSLKTIPVTYNQTLVFVFTRRGFVGIADAPFNWSLENFQAL